MRRRCSNQKPERGTCCKAALVTGLSEYEDIESRCEQDGHMCCVSLVTGSGPEQSAAQARSQVRRLGRNKADSLRLLLCAGSVTKHLLQPLLAPRLQLLAQELTSVIIQMDVLTMRCPETHPDQARGTRMLRLKTEAGAWLSSLLRHSRRTLTLRGCPCEKQTTSCMWHVGQKQYGSSILSVSCGEDADMFRGSDAVLLGSIKAAFTVASWNYDGSCSD